jgi:RNA-directed DNA polymerase
VGKKKVLRRPQKERRTRFLRELTASLRRCRHVPVEEVVREVVNPRVRGWVNYFRWGNSGRDLGFVGWQVYRKVRWFASRQRPSRKGGRRWTKWSGDEVYGQWGLFYDYRVAHSLSGD